MELAKRVQRGRRAIQLAQSRGLDTREWESRLEELLYDAGREPDLEEGFEPWALWEWRRISIPDWRRTLQESIDQGDARREAYARWMLREVLLDSEYQDRTHEK